MVYAGIGSRSIPDEVCGCMSAFARFVAERGWHLRTGGAAGADSAFRYGCEYGCGAATIYIPWKGYNDIKSGWLSPDMEVKAGVCVRALVHAQKYHPNWKACSDGAKKLHARNSYIIFGSNMNAPCNLVICWTPKGEVVGGTGQAIRMATDQGIEMLNLGIYKTLPEMRKALNETYVRSRHHEMGQYVHRNGEGCC